MPLTLNDKITSLEEYKTATDPNGGRISPNWFSASRGFTSPDRMWCTFDDRTGGVLGALRQSEYIPETHWWAHREMMRQQCGIYRPLTRVMANLNQNIFFKPWLLHISKDDENMIAFTASPDDGARDRQTRMTLGRFLRKFLNGATDKQIAAIEAYHRAELNPPIKLINAEKEPDLFISMYQSISSCMSHSLGTYPSQVANFHPVRGYCTPGFHLAVLEKPEGGISARSLLWINPEDENDKRMVRTYGDTALQLWLDKNGYVNRAFDGAYLKTVRLPGNDSAVGDGRKALVAPYLDPGVESMGAGVWDGEDRIYLASPKSPIRKKLPAKYVMSLQSANGLVFGHAFPMNQKCVISGEPIDGIKDAWNDAWHNGKEGPALAKHLTGWVQLTSYLAESAGTKTLYYAPDTARFTHGSNVFVENARNRDINGYVQLSSVLYPDDRGWHSKLATATVSTIFEGSPHRIKIADAVNIIDPGLRLSRVHERAVPSDYERVAAHNERKTWAHPSVPTVRTLANRKVVPGVHPVRQGFDGAWDYEKRMKRVMVLGGEFWMREDQSVDALNMTELPALAKDRVYQGVEGMAVRGNAIKRALYNVFSQPSGSGDFLCPMAPSADDKLQAAYVFDYRDLPMKLILAWFDKDYEAGVVMGMSDDKARELHKFGRMVVALAEETWAKAHPKAADKAAATAVTA